MARFFDAELVSVDRPTDHLWRGAFRRTDGEPLAMRPGQFVMVHREFDGLRLNRSYSLADRALPGDRLDSFTLAVALVEDGRFSRVLEQLSLGETLTMTGPHGRFILRDSDPAHTVLVATGTGIVPFRAMLPQLEQRLEAGERVDLFYGCRVAADFLYHAEFVDLARRFDDFHYTACASRADEEGAWVAAGGHCGRVTNAVKSLSVEPESTIVYLCGNPQMIVEMQTHFSTLGFDRRTVRTEAYESPSDPTPRG